jgi:xanthine dehydrogenase accessory factor
MLVRDDGSIMGTLGGGCLEADVVQAAIMAIRDGKPMTMNFELTEREGGLVCGGAVLVYIEPIVLEPKLVILGAGHVGKTLSTLRGSPDSALLWSMIERNSPTGETFPMRATLL